jgi:hypothetical protein
VVLGYFVAALIGSPVIGNNLGYCFVLIGIIWLVYMGLEPYVRRCWPVMLITWSRVLAGSLRDPLVGRDVLFGLVIGIIIQLIPTLLVSISSGPFLSAESLRLPLSYDTPLRTLSGTRLAATQLALLAVWPVAVAPMFLFVLFLLRLLVRRDHLAAALFTLFFVAGYSPGNWQSAVLVFLILGLIAVAMTRYGLVTLASAFFVVLASTSFPVTLNFSAWYAGTGLVPLVAVLALAAFAFYTSLGGQKVFQGRLLED